MIEMETRTTSSMRLLADDTKENCWDVASYTVAECRKDRQCKTPSELELELCNVVSKGSCQVAKTWPTTNFFDGIHFI